MKKYEIWFGKHPEEIPTVYWPDFIDEANEEAYVASKFATDDVNAFWHMMLSIRETPPSMWYWVFIYGKQACSGAISPDDIEEIIAEWLELPDWVAKNL